MSQLAPKRHRTPSGLTFHGPDIGGAFGSGGKYDHAPVLSRQPPQDLAKLFDTAAAGPPKGKEVVFHTAVSAREAERIEILTGIDVSIYTHTVDVYAARHIINNHGDMAAEAARGQIAITREDLAKLPEILEGALIEKEVKPSKSGRVLLKYIKQEQGTTTVLEEIRTGGKQLALTSLRKFKN